MNELENKKRGCGPLQIIVGIVALLLVIGASVPTFCGTTERANQNFTVGYARQICTALKLYAGDHNGAYPDSALPDAKSSNEVFRLLIREGILEDERIFGAKVSPFMPDNDIGDAPQYNKALEVGENHWAMAKGLTDKAIATSVVILENPVTASPLRWAEGDWKKAFKGRTWKGGAIIVGFNDTSVQAMKLVPDPSNPSRLMLTTNPDWFPNSPSDPPVLDVLE